MSDEELAEIKETAYEAGHRAAWIGLLRQAIRELGYDSPEATANLWAIEREEAIQTLRQLCEDFGDNEWEPDLHLQDIIDKHLGRHLHDGDEDSHGFSGAAAGDACEGCAGGGGGSAANDE